MYKQMLISTDGSEVAQKGVDHGLALARAIGAQVTIVMAAETQMPFAGAEGYMAPSVYLEYAETRRKEAEVVLTNTRETAARMGVEADVVLQQDLRPADAITAAAKANNCDLIVIASHGRSGLGRLLLGSVASEVVTSSPVPVLVVR
jgi:nucleotide-binding universal stress UspA family protein